MRLGIDFGTTRIVVAAVDRGNYPVIAFEAPGGESREWFPSLVASAGGKILYGWEAWAAQENPSATIVRSLKRYLPEAGPQTKVEIGGVEAAMLDLLTGLAASLRAALIEALDGKGPFEVVLGVPANANGNQRFLTSEAFRRAGFDVLGLLNEPSAASIEFGHAARAGAKPQERIAVYDLGGGTFDVSLVELTDQRHEVLANEGIPALGGDDFDELLSELALDAAKIGPAARAAMPQAELFRLHDQARQKKEALTPASRRISMDLDEVRTGWPTVTIPVADFYSRGQAMVDETIHALDDLLEAGGRETVSTVYVTGGGSDLPLVARALKERFGRKVRRSSYTRSATAIGLAIRADAQAGYQLREKFTRNFGVWREADSGRAVIFDPLFLKGTPLPAIGDLPLTVTRQYYPAHNIGHFRYLECSQTGSDGRPAGEVMLWDEIWFPFDPALRDRFDLAKLEVTRTDWGAPLQEVEEKYECDSSGAVTVTISNRTVAYHRSFRLGRWSVPEAPIVPAKRRKPPVKKKAAAKGN